MADRPGMAGHCLRNEAPSCAVPASPDARTGGNALSRRLFRRDGKREEPGRRGGMRETDWLDGGLRLLRERRLVEAIAWFDNALRCCPDDPALHYLRGEALFLLRRLDEALAAHSEAGRLALQRGADRGAAMSGLVPGDFGW